MKTQQKSKTVKHVQLADGIRRDIMDGKLKRGDILPSINALAKSEGVARDTVVKAYSNLRRRGIIEASHGKGFFVRTAELRRQLSVLLVFDVINAYKDRLYNGIRDHLSDSIVTEVYFHHFNRKYFESLLKVHKNDFDMFVVMAWSDPKVYSALKQLPEERTILLDRKIQLKDPGFRYVGQDHGAGFMEALLQAEDRIRTFKGLNLIFQDKQHHPMRIKDSFTEFCQRVNYPGAIKDSLATGSIRKRECYVTIDEEDLVTVVKACQEQGWELGTDVGLVSYNDTPVMEIIAGGVSVITADFYEIGKQLAGCLLNGFGDRREVIIKTQFHPRTTL